MTVRPIPTSSVEIQTGLWAYLNVFTVGKTKYEFYDLYSAEGYCFWNDMTPENYDEYGELVPLEKRLYSQFASTSFRTIEKLNQHFFSVTEQSVADAIARAAEEDTEE